MWWCGVVVECGGVMWWCDVVVWWCDVVVECGGLKVVASWEKKAI